MAVVQVGRQPGLTLPLALSGCHWSTGGYSARTWAELVSWAGRPLPQLGAIQRQIAGEGFPGTDSRQIPGLPSVLVPCGATSSARSPWHQPRPPPPMCTHNHCSLTGGICPTPRSTHLSNNVRRRSGPSGAVQHLSREDA
ncbi:NADH dehydrogenase [Platysternon megacephalum]|uniref:NADH dehydrogenase n=1 Tax=Platysternon megacephalum TaxID=55544 RepID=A0A4D9EH72_9SAUR|nr:NADH dehydrogenase [Platysternon megacephalum]